MAPRSLLCVFIGICLLFSCSADDDSSDPDSGFYAGAKTSTTKDQLSGTWTIFKVGFEDRVADVPVNFSQCGRDFMVFSEHGLYNEYLFYSSDCDYEVNTLSWSLKDGVVTLSDQNYQSEELVVVQVSANEFVAKTRMDVDDDGKLDIVKIYFQRYTPVEFDVVSRTFSRNLSEEARHLISYTWHPYHDAQKFVAYEIYRSVGENCSKNNAALVATITDMKRAEFTDLTPPGEARLCYYLKTKSTTGTLGESELQVMDTYTLEVTPVSFNDPIVSNNSINLSWEKSASPYFSHYELSYTNFPGGITGYGQQVVKVAEISDSQTIAFNDEDPPYLKDPIYHLRVYDIFGNTHYVQANNSKQVDFQREELLPIYNVFSYAIDPTEPVVYLYGYESEGANNLRIVRYNYKSNTTEAVSKHDANTSTDLPIEVITSTDGKEIVLEQGNELHIYDAASLAFKYILKPAEISVLHDFLYTTSGFWLITDGKNMFSYTRDAGNLTLIDKQTHFSNHQGFYNYSVFEIDDNHILLGHKNESESRVYQLKTNGDLTYLKTVNVPIKEHGVRQSQYNASGHYIINFEDGSLFSTLDFSPLGPVQQPQVISGISTNGNVIYGTNNDPNWPLEDSSAHAKTATVFNRTKGQINTLTTKGYPLVIFQNAAGEVCSISSGLKKRNIKEAISYTYDLFIEKIAFP